jgi:sterol 24-C-methyltransferase
MPTIKMSGTDHFSRLNDYYVKSRLGYSLFLGGSQHFGYHPLTQRISEAKAQRNMQDLVGRNLKLTSEDYALDAGCGRGVVSTYLASNYRCRIQGIDVVPYIIEDAKRRAAYLNVADKVNYSRMDYSAMAFEDGAFDAIYTTETLSHSPDVLKTLQEFHRVLKQGGRMALFEYTIAEDKAFSKEEMEILERVMKGSAMDGLKQFRNGRFQEVIGKAGFCDIETQDISDNVGPSLARFRKYALIPYLFVKLLGLQASFPNATAAVELYDLGKKGLIRYNIFTARKR